METVEIDQAALEAQAATLTGVGSSGASKAQEAEMDRMIDEIPDALREQAGMAPRDEKGRFAPKSEEKEQPEVAKGEAEKAKPDAPPVAGKPELEKALTALRLDGFEDADLEGLSEARILALGAKAKTRQASVSERLQKQAEELKKAQELPKAEATAKTEPQAPTVAADFTEPLQAFKEYGEDFTKPMEAFGKAAVLAARENVMQEIQPAVAMLSEIYEITNEMLNESMRREFEARSPEFVGNDEAYQKVVDAYRRLWGEDGATYKDAASTRLGRARAAMKDALRLADLGPIASRKDDSKKKAHGLPSAPARTSPAKAPKTLDEEMEAEAEAVMKRWASQ